MTDIQPPVTSTEIPTIVHPTENTGDRVSHLYVLKDMHDYLTSGKVGLSEEMKTLLTTIETKITSIIHSL